MGRGLIIAAGLVLLWLPAALAEPVLQVDRADPESALLLQWTGGEPTFLVYRSDEPSGLVSAGNIIGDTIWRNWYDLPPSGDLWFYRVDRREPTVPERITIELTRPNGDPGGRPLPVAAHWNVADSAAVAGWDPDFVLDYLDAGYYVIPAFRVEMPTRIPKPWIYYQSGLARARAAGIPFAIRFTQWDRPFTDDPAYAELPPVDNPNVIDAADGTTILAMSDPDGPVARWQEVGSDWGTLPVLDDLQAAWPDPPLVIWLNNFEQPRPRWTEADTSWRYLKNHGPGTSDEDKRRHFGDGWIERDGALWEALSSELSPAWQDVSIPVCYTAFGRSKYGLWSGWGNSSLHIPGRFAPWPLVVNGSPSYYVFEDAATHNETDYQVNSPQVAGMNWNFQLEEALAYNPEQFWEVSVYDGGTQRWAWYRFDRGQTWDTARYRGYVRFALWQSRPRILREFRLAAQDRTPYLPYWVELLEAVKEVHTDPDLTRFWRHGTLVPNDAFPHPYQTGLVAGYTDAYVHRNYLLEADANPPRPWNNDTELAVFSLAYVLGEAPAREWLLFAYGPLADHDDVTITLPGYGDVVVDVPRGTGAFWVLGE